MSKQMFYTTLGSKFNNPNALYVELVFDQTPEFTKSIAPLLYDKKFSFGIRLDDGLYKAFTNVFSVLYGNGIPDEQNNTHTGIRSTDGCGNDVVWAGDFAMPTNSQTAHADDQTAKIRWSTLKFARDFGFGVMYHGHETPLLDNIIPTYTVVNDVKVVSAWKPGYADWDAVYNAIRLDMQNAKTLIQTNLGFTPLIATVPSGHDEIRSCEKNDGILRAPCFEEGFWTVTGRSSGEKIGPDIKSIPMSPGLDVTSITNQWIQEGNFFPVPYHYTGATASGETIQAIKDAISIMSTSTGNFAKCFFTHDITYNENEGADGGMTIQEFKELMEWIDLNYGKTSGKDEVWFTSVQSVLEYVYCRLNTTINQYIENNRIILEIIPPEFSGMRRPALTFKINSDIPVRTINIHNIDKFSQNVLNNTSGIINVEWSEEHYAAADRMVTQLESSQSQMDKLYAQTLTNLISIPDKKNTLQARINAVEIITQIIWLFDFGRISAPNYSADYPYNLIGTTSASGTAIPTNSQFTNLFKSTTNGTIMTLTVGANFTQNEAANYPGNQSMPINSGYFLDNALKDYITVVSGSNGIITLTGLNNNKKYDFVMIANRHSITSTTKYTIYNDLTTPTFSQNVNVSGKVGVTNGNFDSPGLVSNAIPMNGTLYLKVEGVGSAGYLNAMKIIEHD